MNVLSEGETDRCGISSEQCTVHFDGSLNLFYHQARPSKSASLRHMRRCCLQLTTIDYFCRICGFGYHRQNKGKAENKLGQYSPK